MLTTIYNKEQTVFSFKELLMLDDVSDIKYLRQRINYYVKTGKLLNLRKGIYSKLNYNSEELASKIYSPSYISLEYVLRKEGIIFQYSRSITCISYLSRDIKVTDNEISFSKIKNSILINTMGIRREKNGINIATAERAFLDRLYLRGNVFSDFSEKLNKDILFQLVQIYNSKTLVERIKKIYS
jgi:hypothetical protein